jgi:hypothetical protein
MNFIRFGRNFLLQTITDGQVTGCSKQGECFTEIQKAITILCTFQRDFVFRELLPRLLSIRMFPSIRPRLICSDISDLLEDDSLWPDKCLQDLSRKLGLQTSGSREELIMRLRIWHNSRHEGQAFQGSNFYLLPVKENTVLPQFLSPYKPIEHGRRRSILRKRCRASAGGFTTPPKSAEGKRAIFDDSDSSDDRVPETSPKRGPHGTRKRKKLVQFSPYNRVQLISPRRPGDNVHVRQLYQSIKEGTFENSEDEEDEWSRSVNQSSTDSSSLLSTGSNTPSEESSSPSDN